MTPRQPLFLPPLISFERGRSYPAHRASDSDRAAFSRRLYSSLLGSRAYNLLQICCLGRTLP